MQVIISVDKLNLPIYQILPALSLKLSLKTKASNCCLRQDPFFSINYMFVWMHLVKLVLRCFQQSSNHDYHKEPKFSDK